MKKLKIKVFFTIFTILTVFLVSILLIFNIGDYTREKVKIENNLFRTNNIKNEFDRQKDYTNPKPEYFFDTNNNPRLFMDATIYTVLLNDKNEIIDIVSHTEDETVSEKIKEESMYIIDNNEEITIYIGNLYYENYSYTYIPNNYLMIIDNSETNNKLLSTLKISVVLFLLLETIIFLISYLLSKWISKPVEMSFNKQKQFIADASHELKTPLSVIIASSEALDKDINERKWLYNIQNESERMNKLITDLLDLAKIENDNIKLEYEVNNLSKIVEKSVLTLESLIYEKNIKLEYDIKEDISFKCDSDNIKQLITILLDNAIKHSSKDGKIIVNLISEKDNIILEVKNKGEAIPKEEEEKIFERFYRIDKSRNRKENRYGLGLAIAKGIVVNHNGNISAYSKNGYTIFKVIFKKKSLQ